MQREVPESPVLGYLTVQLSILIPTPQIHSFIHSIRIY